MPIKVSRIMTWWFLFCFDNVQFAVHARVNKADQSAQFHIMALSLAIKHIVLSVSEDNSVAVVQPAKTFHLSPFSLHQRPFWM